MEQPTDRDRNELSQAIFDRSHTPHDPLSLGDYDINNLADAILAAGFRRQPTFQEVATVLNEWLLLDVGPSRFDRGLHLLRHLGRGGTLEEYGLPSASGGASNA
jgi:hypothetical protein